MNVVLHPLPPCTPELQPAESLWPLAREAVANEGYDDLGVMEPVLMERCRSLIEHPEIDRKAVGYRWAIAPNKGVIQAIPDEGQRCRLVPCRM